MKSQFWKPIIPSLLLLSLLSACGGSDGGNASRVQAIATAPGTAEPTDVNDPGGLQQDLISVFGNPDGEPVAVNSGDNLQTVLNRAAGN
ncbi:MAG: hypothetical protein R3E89_15085 [Thiolinea sp.]